MRLRHLVSGVSIQITLSILISMHLYLYTDILFYFIFHSYPNCPLYFLSQSLSISCCVVCFSSLPISCNQPQQQQPRYIRPCRCPFLCVPLLLFLILTPPKFSFSFFNIFLLPISAPQHPTICVNYVIKLNITDFSLFVPLELEPITIRQVLLHLFFNYYIS